MGTEEVIFFLASLVALLIPTHSDRDRGIFVMCHREKNSVIELKIGDVGYISTFLSEPEADPLQALECKLELRVLNCSHCQIEVQAQSVVLPVCDDAGLKGRRSCLTSEEGDCRYFVFTEINNHRRDSVVLHGQATNKVFTTMWSNVVQISYCYGNKAPTTDDDWRLKFTVKDINQVLRFETGWENGFIRSPGFGVSYPGVEVNYTYELIYLNDSTDGFLQIFFTDIDIAETDKLLVWLYDSKGRYKQPLEVKHLRLFTALSSKMEVEFQCRKDIDKVTLLKNYNGFKFQYYFATRHKSNNFRRKYIQRKTSCSSVLSYGGVLEERWRPYNRLTAYDCVWTIPIPQENLKIFLRMQRYLIKRTLAGERLISIHNGTTSDSPKLFESTEFMEGFEKKVNFTSTSGFYIRFIGNITKYHGIRLIYTVYDDRPLTHSASVCYSRIDALRFYCGNGWCISRHLMCDERNHCGDNSDEADAHCVATPPPEISTTRKPIRCPYNQYPCDNGWQCYTLGMKCNGYRECSDGTDEKSCRDVQIICAYKRCPGEDVCYSRDKECDGLNHCAYGNDETDCKENNDKGGSSLWLIVLLVLPLIAICLILGRVCSKAQQLGSTAGGDEAEEPVELEMTRVPGRGANDTDYLQVLLNSRENNSFSAQRAGVRRPSMENLFPISVGDAHFPASHSLENAQRSDEHLAPAPSRESVFRRSHGHLQPWAFDRVEPGDPLAPPPSYHEALASLDQHTTSQEDLPLPPPPSYETVAHIRAQTPVPEDEDPHSASAAPPIISPESEEDSYFTAVV